ncbi:hypothetical protein [Bathymodiolus platifrons methanotrophic gill symbiont]|uniref:hypothetical protein n=1 Tax=Bathymodiolus platifrons methanotrophic gill symbiont TaxID=113268 RepID=UPI001C8D3ACC|nr:hypothetical protein [Bathymodiolus platifrons methanotrophic gill symbiont]
MGDALDRAAYSECNSLPPSCPVAYQGLKIITPLRLRFPDFKRGNRYFCESLFWASQTKQAAKT